ncbi:BAH and coiled-coil domain-containing protein 1 [Arapaima gigas]
MEGRDFAPPAHLLSERGALVHRAASRIAPGGPGPVQPPHGPFQPGKYYPPTIHMAPHSGGGLMGNSSASFMGTFLASGLGSPPSHPPHPSGPPSSPPSPSFRGGPHSGTSQIWFPHSHEAPGYPRFSGSLAPTFLPMSHLDHHGNSSVLYGQHRFYDPQKDNFYLRSLPSQPPLLSANHSFPAISRATPGHPLGSCSRERDSSSSGGPHKGLKEGGVERGVVLLAKDKDRPNSKQETKDRASQSLQLASQPHPHLPHQHHQQHHPDPHPQHLQHVSSLVEEASRPLGRHKAPVGAEYKDNALARGKHLSACLLTAKLHNGDSGASSKGPLSGCGGGGTQGQHGGMGVGSGRCTKDGVLGEKRASEHPADCLERGQVLHHAVSYSMPPPLAGGANPGGFHCLPLHPSHPHPHHPHHPHHHHHHHHPDFYCSPPPAPLPAPPMHDKGLVSSGGHDFKVTGPTFVPSVGQITDKGSGPFQLGNPDCRGVPGGGGGGASKDKSVEKGGNNSGSGTPSSCQRKQQQQSSYGKVDKTPDWLPSHHNESVQQPRSRSRDCANGADIDIFRASLPQGAKSGPYLGTAPYRDCSQGDLIPGARSQEGKGGGSSGAGGCMVPRDGQKVARIRHQQHSRAESGLDGPGAKRKPEVVSLVYGSGSQQQVAPPPLPPLAAWPVRSHQIQLEEEQRKTYTDPFGGGGDQQPEQQPGMGPQDVQTPQDEGSAMKSLLQYSSQQQPLLLSHKSAFGGLGCLESGAGAGTGNSCVLQESKHTLPPRKVAPTDGDRTECGGNGRNSREGDAPPPHGEGEVRQPPVGIAVAVARQRDPPSCRPLDSHPGSNRQGRVMPAMKGMPRPMFPLDREREDERKRMCEEPLGLPYLDRDRGRDRELLLRENKERVEFARIHPTSGCHGDLTSHLMVPAGSSLQASQLGADPAAHAHPAHHHWMPRTGSPSLWMTGPSYGIGHAALHQNLPPGFSAAMPSPLQPVLPLPQDAPAQLVVLPTEPTAHPAAHHLADVMDQSGLWPPVYGSRGPASHMQHPAVYSRSQFLRQQELYALQQHQHQHQHHHQHHQHQQQQQQQQQQQRTAQELEHRSSQVQAQRKTEEPTTQLEDLLSEPRTPKPAKPFSLAPPSKSTPSPGACAPRLSPCCHSPSLHPHPKSTPCTPCPAQSPAAVPRSPALSPAPPHPSKGAETQDKRGEGQPPQDYPESLEPDLPPGYTYPAISMGYRGGPSPHDVRLAEPADLEAVQAEPPDTAPQSLHFPEEGEEPEHKGVEIPIRTTEEESMEAEPQEDVEDVGTLGGPSELEKEELFVGPVTEVQPSDGVLASGIETETLAEDLSAGCQKELGVVRTGDDEQHVEMEPERMEESPHGVHVEQDCSTDILSPGTTCKENPGTMLPEEIQTEMPSSPPPSPAPCSAPAVARCIWSLELLIAAALCGDVHPDPTPVALPPPFSAPACTGHRGMELLSELASLELRHQHNSSESSQGEELLTFDLQSLATLAAARALELDSACEQSTNSGRLGPLRRTLNLRRKSSWTPRHEPACPAKVTIETLDGQELAMRVQLAELQRRYKEKQKELAKLQRKHDHQKEETCRSPARRGPGRPRKRKSNTGTGPSETPRRTSSLGVALSSLAEDTRAGGESQRKKKRLSNRTYDHLGSTQMKERNSRPGIRQGVLNSKIARKVSQLKRKAKAKRGTPVGNIFLHKEASCPGLASQRPPMPDRQAASESGGQSDTAPSMDGNQRAEAHRRSPTQLQTRPRLLRTGNGRPQAQRPTEDKDTSPTESESSEAEDENEGSYDSEDGHDSIKTPLPKDLSPCATVTDPSPSSIVKLEANQKAKNKKERQGLLGTLNLPGVEGDVKVRKRAPCAPITTSTPRKHPELLEPEATKRPQGSKAPRSARQQKALLRGRLGARMEPYSRRGRIGVLSMSSETLKKGAHKNSALQVPLCKASTPRRGCWAGLAPLVHDEDLGRGRRNRNKQPKGHAVSRLLESFTADEGFHMDEDSSFSEGDEKDDGMGNLLHSRKVPPAAVPNCVLTKELLVDGLKILISKEDELLYVAYVQTLELPDIYSVVIEGERGNRPRIYSLEQLLQEAVLEVRPETDTRLKAGTRVCAYWSERSRCLYPGYVQRGSPGEEQKEGSVMVEFDDGDRGWISLHNVRFLPPDYQIHCAEPSPALISHSRQGPWSSALEKSVLSNTSTERQDNMATASMQESKTFSKSKSAKPKSVNSGTKSPVSDSMSKSSAPLGWPALAIPRKRPNHNFFQFNGTPRKILKGKEEMFPITASTATPAKGIFRSTFEVDSFSSIANGYSSFGSQSAIVPLSTKSPCSRGRRPSEVGNLRGRKASAEFLVKLDHEGVTSPKTKSSKALLLLSTSGQSERIEKTIETKGLGDISSSMGYSHPILLVKDNKKGGGTRAELLLKGASHLRKPSPVMAMREYSEFGMNCLSNCHSFYSDMDEEDEEEESRLVAAPGGLRTAGRFLSRLSMSSSSSGSSSSSSSGSLSSSSLCSSDNDSSYSSDDEESSTMLLQGCLSSHHALLQQSPEPPSAPAQHTFVAKAKAVPSNKGAGGNNCNVSTNKCNNSANMKPVRRKDCPSSPSLLSSSKSPKDLARRERLPSANSVPKMASFLPARQLWRWSGNPTQRRGMKGKARKLFYKAIVRGRDTVRVGDCAVFLSSGRPNLPYIGRIENFWESWASNMVVKVKWFYHPEETKLGKRHRDGKHALYQSSHEDENDVQTISHKCQVVSREEYEQLSCSRKSSAGIQDLYYLAGSYDPTSGQLVTVDGVSILC